MLQKVSERSQKLLDLADYIEKLDDNDFDMTCWGKCICGHAVKREQGFVAGAGVRQGADVLGISIQEATQLFAPVGVQFIKKAEAVSVLRRFAVTDDIVWTDAPVRAVHEIGTVAFHGIVTAICLAAPALFASLVM